MVAQAFVDYLIEADFAFLLKLSPDNPQPQTPLCDLDKIAVRAADEAAEGWQALLYFLVHLVPVEEIGKLLHQTRKWGILVGKSAPTAPAEETSGKLARKAQAVLELYLDMHDAKFEGGMALVGVDAYANLFASAEFFHRIFPVEPGDDIDDRRIPKRGLREIMRFGHLPVLRKVFEKYPVTAGEVSAFLAAEAPGGDGEPPIAQWQKKREELHEQWTRDKKKFRGDALKDYVETMAKVVRHRHLAAHVTLTDHVRLHRLLMSVLGRLVDFSGLWERDLYFVTLALMHEAKVRPDQVFKQTKKLADGQIVAAIQGDLNPTPEANAIKAGLDRYFGTVSLKKNVRNDFAHFNMLKRDKLPVDLTACINAARELMAYDRKLKNAVSQAVRENLAREGLALAWTMRPDHKLGSATMTTRQAPHLGKMRLEEKVGDKPRKHEILENLHGQSFIEMAAALFRDCRAQRAWSLADIRADNIEWEQAKRGTHAPKKHGHSPHRGGGDRNFHGRNRN